jgi:hypothetical protein
MSQIANFVPKHAELGVGLALRNDEDEYIFFFARKTSRLPLERNIFTRESGDIWNRAKRCWNAGNVYHIVIFQAKLRTEPRFLQRDEVSGLITMNKDQVMQGVSRKPTLRQLLDEGSKLLVGGNGRDNIDAKIRCGTGGTRRETDGREGSHREKSVCHNKRHTR